MKTEGPEYFGACCFKQVTNQRIMTTRWGVLSQAVELLGGLFNAMQY